MNMLRGNYIFFTVGVLYFFFNSFLLPEGLLYTTLLTPFFLINLLQKKESGIYFYFLLASSAVGMIQCFYVTHIAAYLKSFILLQSVAVFVLCAFKEISKDENRLIQLYKIAGSINLILVIISLLLLLVPSWSGLVWYRTAISSGISVMPRLKLLTYEASYYSLLLVPVFAYYLLRLLLLKGKAGILLISTFLSLVLSFSLGIIGGLVIAVILLYAFNLNELKRKINLNYVGIVFVLAAVGIIVAYRYYPDNPLYKRLANIWNGTDTSAKGRTTDAFHIAWDITRRCNIWLGTGLGQLKYIGRDYIIQYYRYDMAVSNVRIPNAVAETLNVYGIAGIIIRFGLIIFLFVKTKVWQNYYRLFLFMFIFIYQFTGSYLFNLAEYMIWMLAFNGRLFQKFNRQYFLNQAPV